MVPFDVGAVVWGAGVGVSRSAGGGASGWKLPGCCVSADGRPWPGCWPAVWPGCSLAHCMARLDLARLQVFVQHRVLQRWGPPPWGPRNPRQAGTFLISFLYVRIASKGANRQALSCNFFLGSASAPVLAGILVVGSQLYE